MRRAWLWAAILIGAAVVCGCGTRKAAPREAVPNASTFPVVLKDALGVEVVVGARPERIVSVAPTVTEMLFALGAGERVVGVTEQCNWPPEVEAVPKIGGYWTPSAEKTLGARPDLVIGSRGNPREFLAAVRRSGCPVFTVDPKTLEGILSAIEQIACVIGEPGAGEELIGGMRARLAAVAGKVAGVPEEERPTAFLVVQVNPVWTAGSETFVDDAIRAAGGRNVAADKKGFAPFSTESLMAADPDFLLLSTMDGDAEQMKREVEASAALRGLSAVREGRMVVLEADPIMRPGPRIVEAVEAMAGAFYGGRFRD
jgi:iron complex transport system substrate-binding protein